MQTVRQSAREAWVNTSSAFFLSMFAHYFIVAPVVDICRAPAGALQISFRQALRRANCKNLFRDLPREHPLRHGWQRAYADMICALFWTHFLTVTFRGNPHPDLAGIKFRQALRRANCKNLYFVRVTEMQRRGVEHYHMLGVVHGDKTVLRLCDKFQKYCGLFDAKPVVNQKAVAEYCVKYVTKACASERFELDFSRSVCGIPPTVEAVTKLRYPAGLPENEEQKERREKRERRAQTIKDGEFYISDDEQFRLARESTLPAHRRSEARYSFREKRTNTGD